MRRQEGFTLVELMAAALVLVVGMLAIVTVLQTGLGKTNLSRQRTAATNLVRELTETARSADYDSLTPALASAEMQAENVALRSTSAGAWTIKRGLTVYTVTYSACTFDDPADRIAAPPATPDNRCVNNPGGQTGDPNGDDFRRLTFDVTWSAQGDPQTFTQTTLLANPAGGIGPRITSFANAGTVTGGSSVSFNVTTTVAGAVHWNADDGVSEGDAIRTVGFTGWRIDWNLGQVGTPNAVLDGTYTVTAQAFDDRGIAGDTKVASVTLNRSVPFAPTGFTGGHDTRDGDWVELEWNLNSERDIVGYQVFWAGPDGVVSSDDVRVCPSLTSGSTRLDNNVTSCQDLAPATTNPTKYYVVGLDSTAVGAPAMLEVTAPGPRPDRPGTLTVSGTDTPVLQWTPPASGGATSYRVYRDGTAIKDRLERTPDLTFTDGGAGNTTHRYYVSAVDGKFNESDLLGPVQWP